MSSSLPARVSACLSLALMASIGCLAEVQLPELEPDELVCEAPLAACEQDCVNLEVDEDHCGACSDPCASDEQCVAGQCEPYCGEGCEPYEECIDSECVCRVGLDDCAGECVRIESSFDHCGACSDSCAGGEVCLDSECVDSCPLDDECDGACVDLESDPLNCGACGNTCFTNELCVAGLCTHFEYPDECDACPCDCTGDFTCCFDVFLNTEVCVLADSCGA